MKIKEQIDAVADFLARPGSLREADEVADALVSATRLLRQVNLAYEQLIPEDQKAVRRVLYQRQGKFGKEIVPVLDKFIEFEQSVGVLKGDEDE